MYEMSPPGDSPASKIGTGALKEVLGFFPTARGRGYGAIEPAGESHNAQVTIHTRQLIIK